MLDAARAALMASKLSDDVLTIKRVQVRTVGNEQIISPVDSTWGSFFLNGQQVSEDFLPERASQK
jgi:antitoxin VapB